MTTGCPTPDIMYSVGSEIPGTALRGWLPLLTATVVRRNSYSFINLVF